VKPAASACCRDRAVKCDGQCTSGLPSGVVDTTRETGTIRRGSSDSGRHDRRSEKPHPHAQSEKGGQEDHVTAVRGQRDQDGRARGSPPTAGNSGAWVASASEPSSRVREPILGVLGIFGVPESTVR
jgi:hypothetical protein